MREIMELLCRVASQGHKVFLSGTYNLNIIGIRSSSRVANVFDDSLSVICFDENGQLIHRTWTITTDPGTYHLLKPSRVEGTAILCAGQYRGAYKVGKHNNKYEALVQHGGAVKVWRDNDRDNILEHRAGSDVKGYFGINIHKASSNKGGSKRVDRWSAGCQVFQDPQDFEEFMNLCKKQIEYNPSWQTFTYTLLED